MIWPFKDQSQKETDEARKKVPSKEIRDAVAKLTQAIREADERARSDARQAD